MKNFEKYEKEIKEALSQNKELFILTSNLSGKTFLFTADILKWLYEDYKEPLLTDEEREYLKVVIKPYKDIAYIRKSIAYLNIDSKEGVYVSICLDGYEFKGLEYKKKYSLEELGL